MSYHLSACIFKISKSRNGDALMEYAEPLRVKKIVKDLVELWL